MYKIVQTGANNQVGGLKVGLFNVLNQPFTDEEVKNPETAPTAKGITIDMNSL